MARALSTPHITPEQYLSLEQDAEPRHEYVAGQVHTRVGSSKAHNRIAIAFASALQRHLAGGPCDAYVADRKVRTAHAFCYPDVVVDCQPSDRDPYWTETPVLVIEVVSPATRAHDEREKRAAYQALPTLREYVLAEQDRAEVRIFRRQSDGWDLETLGPDEVIRLTGVDLDLAMQGIYARAWR
jgi:Uma2 family endonuclease